MQAKFAYTGMASKSGLNRMTRIMGLRDLRTRRKLSQERVAEEVGISVSYYSRLETGERNLSGKLVKKLSSFFQCDPGELFVPDSSTELVAHPVQNVKVLGHVLAGDWREAVEWDPASQYFITIPMTRSTARSAFALEVQGESMNREYKSGDILICVPVMEFRQELQNGVHVICEHFSSDGLVEATVKEFQRDADGTTWLWPRSFSPKHQQPIQIPWPQPDEHESDEIYRISAVVVGSFTLR